MGIIKKRCIRCRKELREDGTCQNPECVRYVSEEETVKETDTTHDKEENRK